MTDFANGGSVVVEGNARRRQLLCVSSGLGLQGGGTAVVGRLFAHCVARFCADRALEFVLLNMGSASPLEPATGHRTLSGGRHRLASRLLGHQLAGRPAAIVFDHLGPARVQALLPAWCAAPYLVMLHGIEAWRPLGWSHRRALRNATVRVANSRYTRARLLAQWAGEVGTLPLALEKRPPLGEPDGELLREAGEGFLLIVGRMSRNERYKGHDELLTALARVLTRWPATRLVVAGEGDDRHRLEAQAERLGVAGSTLFTGFVSEATLGRLYRRCVALVLPSRDEGFGLVYLEAMRAAKPCLAARGGAAEEIVVDGQTGLLVEYGNAEELSGALLRLLTAPEEAAAMGRAGRRRWQSHFTLERFENELTGHLDRLLAVDGVRG